jgi:hypothetical protein
MCLTSEPMAYTESRIFTNIVSSLLIRDFRSSNVSYAFAFYSTNILLSTKLDLFN